MSCAFEPCPIVTGHLRGEKRYPCAFGLKQCVRARFGLAPTRPPTQRKARKKKKSEQEGEKKLDLVRRQ
jgi:hypothetical protein